MEFACGFVYVPHFTQKEGKQSGANVFKRSALHPPMKWIRPHAAPPPPPTLSAKVKAQQSPTSPKITEQFGNSREVEVTKLTSSYKDTEFHKRLEAAASMPPQRTTPPHKTALLPPHMRPAGNSPSTPYKQPCASSNANHLIFTYDEPKKEPDFNTEPWDPDYSYSVPEGSGGEVKLPAETGIVPASAPGIPPRPAFMKLIPEYLMLLPSSPSATPHLSSPPSKDKEPLPGNPNVVLVSLGKLLSEERVQPTQGEPTCCSQCGSVLNTCFDNVVEVCYFCHSTSSPMELQCPLNAHRDGLFLLNPNEKPLCAADTLLLFCIDVSGSMSITSQVMEGEHIVYKSRLQFVQEAVLQCVQTLSEQHPDIQVGLVTFNYHVTVHGHEGLPSHTLSGAELTDSEYLKEAGASFPSPPPLTQTKDCRQIQVMGLSANGTTALGPAALLTIAMASRQPGSKVIICTDGKANAELGNLEEEDNDARTLLSSTIFYTELGEYAANQGVTVSVLSIEGTDCRLDELGRLTDRTGGKAVIVSPNRLHTEFEEIIQNQIVATHCSVTLLLPKSLRMKGEREAGHKGTREVGNVNPYTEITFQFGASDQNTEVPPPAPGSHVSIQLQIRYKQGNGRMMLRVLTADREVTDDSSAALSSLSLAIIQLNSSQASAALAVRGRFLDAREEGELQRKLIERAIEHNHSAEEKHTFQEWIKKMEPIYSNIHSLTRRKSVISDSQPLTDAGAALFYAMKHSNRKSISLKKKLQL
ncbi:circularly permutated Ras protein 1-like isoform X2 [Melanotaenia boesemani]|uniref:circularly permutated Ras protein 1-like isoform X2 n=1 Tax=Melanotaenia boesemani TaxID=1250792 RepID=UPI001C03D9BF|nr:circularly permutated Ras protein 1-like isoform X2 [Melanotaenia boesemani]